MDPRVRRHAEILVEHCTAVQAGDDVLIRAAPVAEDLAVALSEKLGERGATPMHLNNSHRATRAHLRSRDPDNLAVPEHLLAAIEASDVVIGVSGSENTHETGDVPQEINAAYARAMDPIQEELDGKRRCGTQYPTPAAAQAAEMSTEAYEDFVWEAVDRDWDAQREYQQQLVELLEPAEEVRIVSGERTDLTMRVDGMHASNDYGEENLPGGEVFTAPVPDSVEGTVHFDLPLVTRGREIQDVSLEFENGEVVDHSAAQHEGMLSSILDTDDGARRLGELGVGMNRDIDRFTKNMLFDEKMGDTVHLALGYAFEETVGDDRERNESAIHLDMLIDMSEDSSLEIDGETIQRGGTFRFEDGLEQ